MPQRCAQEDASSQRRSHDPDDVVGFVVGDGQRWQELEYRRVVVREHGEDAGLDHRTGREHRVALVLQLQSHEQASPAQLAADPGEPVLEALAELDDPFQEAGRFDDVEHRQCCDTTEFGAAERGDVDERVVGEERVEFGGHERGRDRIDAPAQPFPGHDDVGLESLLLEVPHRAGSAEPGLDLVEHEADTALPTQPLHPGEIAGARDRHAERRRDRLEDHGSGRVPDDVGEGVEVVEGHLDESGEIGAERIPVLGVARCHRQPGVTVVAADGGDDPGAAGVRAGDLEGEIDRLAAGDAEHHAREQAVGRRGETLGELAPANPTRDGGSRCRGRRGRRGPRRRRPDSDARG